MKKIVQTSILLLAMVLVGFTLVPSVCAEDLSLEPGQYMAPFEFEGCTHVIVPEATSVSELECARIQKTDELNIPPCITRYDLVSFDHILLNKNVRSILPMRINGKQYVAEMERMNFENIDDGIDSYKGTLQGIEDSVVLLTVAENVIIGNVAFDETTYWITPVEPRYRTEKNPSPLHIIYNSKDVEVSEMPVLIDNGPVEPPEGYNMSHANKNHVEPTEALRDQYATVDVLVATDNQFYQDESNWKSVAQYIISEANNQFGRDDIKVSLCVVKYDDSKRSDLSNDGEIIDEPLDTFISHFDQAYLNSNRADIAIYLGGYDKKGTDPTVHGATYGYDPNRARHCWAQMVPDSDDGMYWGTAHARKCVTIHETGHIFDAHHENTGGYNQAYSYWTADLMHTVMWSYFFEHQTSYEFSSDDYRGDATHDNALAISEAKWDVCKYVRYVP